MLVRFYGALMLSDMTVLLAILCISVKLKRVLRLVPYLMTLGFLAEILLPTKQNDVFGLLFQSLHIVVCFTSTTFSVQSALLCTIISMPPVYLSGFIFYGECNKWYVLIALLLVAIVAILMAYIMYVRVSKVYIQYET